MDAVTRVRLQAALVCLLLLGAGFGLGLGAARSFALRRLRTLSDGPPGSAELRTLIWVGDAELHLDAAQREQAMQVLERYRPRFVEARRRAFPELDALRLARYAELRQLMHPDQLPGFDALVEHYEAQLRQSVGLYPDGGPAPLEGPP